MSGCNAIEIGVRCRAHQVVTTSPGEMVKIPGGAEPKRGLRISDKSSEPSYAKKLRNSANSRKVGAGARHTVRNGS